MTGKIEVAAKATSEIVQLADEAKSSLEMLFGRTVNGYGVFSDWSMRRQDLRAALTKIQQAVEIAEKTAWPYPRDYSDD